MDETTTGRDGHALRPSTRAVRTRVPDVPVSRPLTVPLYQGHTFAFDSPDDFADAFADANGAYYYARYGNPTVRALEEAVAGLEGGAAGLAAGSGMGTISGLFWSLLRSGDHVVAQRRLYGGTTGLLDGLRDRWGVQVDYVDADPGSVRAALRPNTRVLFLETISNPVGQVADLPALFAVAREAGVLSVVDNTFATPVLYRPLADGADVVLHSTSKYLNGHADAVGGVAVFADARLYERVRDDGRDHGAVPDPFGAWLTLRGLSTLAVRMRAVSAAAEELARRLAAHPAVAVVHHPSLPSHPDHATARRLLPNGAGGVLAFEPAGGRAAGEAFCRALRVAVLGPSLGDVRTLVMQPATTSHRQLDDAALAAAGISPALVRVAVGLEDVEDLWADLARALSAV
ncbi:trans-sulfuration enzyme family protein [Nocardiopsis trehalosi]|jgi:methionine-gamma-lyase|uniref:trans-sulfuration enzyme family protein n=1 Tax=Nocardiopsis trehalosi TaxID=109329 RepID=UPI00082CC2F3|nr:aminotransferase class I/II-fold pyridoxal phosphate-dependent enzyme [Nocardiopsis trehalosi]